MSSMRIALYGCAVALGLGVLPLPYGYYGFLRVAAIVAFMVVGYVAVTTRSWPTLVVAICAVLVFNPAVPLRMPKEAWACVDAAASAYLAIVASQVVTGFSAYGPPERTVEAIARVLGFAILLGLFAGVGFTVVAAVIVIPLKWLGVVDLRHVHEPTRLWSGMRRCRCCPRRACLPLGRQVPCSQRRLTAPSSGRSKGRFAPFGPPLMSDVRPHHQGPWV
jgi:hypothetical protein